MHGKLIWIRGMYIWYIGLVVTSTVLGAVLFVDTVRATESHIFVPSPRSGTLPSSDSLNSVFSCYNVDRDFRLYGVKIYLYRNHPDTDLGDWWIRVGKGSIYSGVWSDPEFWEEATIIEANISNAAWAEYDIGLTGTKTYLAGETICIGLMTTRVNDGKLVQQTKHDPITDIYSTANLFSCDGSAANCTLTTGQGIAPFTVYLEPLSGTFDIDIPLQNATSTSPVTVSGSCSSTSSHYLFNFLYSTTSGEFWNPSVACNTGSYQYTANLQPGHWFLQASSSGQYRERDFFIVPTVITAVPTNLRQWFLDWSCNISYLSNWDPCATIGASVASVYDLAVDAGQQVINAINEVEPYSYVPQIVGAVQSGLVATTSTPFATSTINISTEYFELNSQILSPDAFTDILTQDQWNSLRTYANILLYFSFLLYLFRLVKDRII